jgi:hypothetical protein
MTRSALVAFIVLALLGAANLAYSWHLDQQNRDREITMQRTVDQSIAALGRADGSSAASLSAKLDRNWKMIVVTRKAACHTYYNTVQVPHYLYAPECNLPNMSPQSVYVKFWQTPTNWNSPN